MAYGASIPDLCHRAATYVDKIQTEAAVVNLKTTKTRLT
jgi:hypothetical protein